ncbi:alpha/beta fold hydrolase [Halobacillus litoralis]|nr:alpha/beta fold hydrolase [Halobacillus litoralis]
MISANKSIMKWLSLLVGSILIGLIFFMINSKSSSSEPIDKEEMTPTLFIHGYKGGPRSFQTMIDRMQSLEWGKKQMVIYVASDGDLTIQGGIQQSRTPFIQVLFENNRASINSQTHWLEGIMQRLKYDYEIQQVNIIGHSMGGLISANYLLNAQEFTAPKVEKLAVIASPFKGISKEGYFKSNYGEATTDLQPKSEALVQMIEKKNQFPPHVDVLAIAGIINKEAPEQLHWDGLVHASSVKGLQDIVPFGQYQEEMVYNKQASHSGLHELAEVDLLLGKFLWEQQN